MATVTLSKLWDRRWLEVRDRTVIATKVFASHLKYQQVIDACEGSLKNLQTDYIDLYQIHWPAGSFNNEVVPIEETMRSLNDLKQQGKIRAIGVSNFSRDQLAEASQYGRIDSLQPSYNLFWRGIEQDAMPYCVENNISILAYSPLAQGLLTDKFGADHQFEKGDIRNKNKLRTYTARSPNPLKKGTSGVPPFLRGARGDQGFTSQMRKS